MLSATNIEEQGEGREIQQVSDYLESPLGATSVGVWMSELAAVLESRSLETWLGSGLVTSSPRGGFREVIEPQFLHLENNILTLWSYCEGRMTADPSTHVSMYSSI